MSFTKPTKPFLLPNQSIKVIDVSDNTRKLAELTGFVHSIDPDKGQGVIEFCDPVLDHTTTLIFYSKELKEIGIEELLEGDKVQFTLRKKHIYGREIMVPSDIFRVSEVLQEYLTEKNNPVSFNTLNQGKIFPNDKIFDWKNLRFRSPGEMKIAEALDRANVLFLPNCAVRLTTSDSKRENKELDFLVCYEGNWGILEVDGETYHNAGTRVKEQERERCFRHHRILIYERFEHSRCLNQPDNVVREFLELLRKAHS